MAVNLIVEASQMREAMEKKNAEKQAILEKEKVEKEAKEKKARNESTLKCFGTIYDNKTARIDRFRKSVQESLLSECIIHTMDKAVKTPLYENADVLKRQLASNFIKEEGVNNIIDNCITKSLMLSDMMNLVDEYTDILLEKYKESGDENEVLSDVEKEEFFNKLDDMTPDEVTMEIHARTNAGFNQSYYDNASKAEDIKTTMQYTNEKIMQQNTQSMKEHCAMIGKRAEQKIRNRKKGIFECVLSTTVETILKNEQAKPMYVNESGSLDMDKISDHCKVVYGFLETLNTCRFKDMDAEYIKEQLDELKQA